MTEVRKDVQHFMRECERLLGFAHMNGGLTAEECESLKYYADELATHVNRFCGVTEDQSTSDTGCSPRS